HLYQRDIENLKIPLPTIREQIEISKIFSDLDSKIELNLQMNKTLESIAQALFKHWFIDFEFPDENGRPYKSSGGKMVDSELGKIPEGWSVGKLANYVNVIKGCSYRSEDLKKSNIALVTLKSFNRGGGFNQDGYKEYVGDYDQEQILNEGDIIVAQTDLTQKAEVIGRAAIVNSLGKYSRLIASLDLQIVRPKARLSINYIYYLLNNDAFRNHSLSYTNGTTVLHLNKNAVSVYTIVIPPKGILERFDLCVTALIKKIGINIRENTVLENIRDSLLPKLMSGKIRVPLEEINDKKNE
ncbi:MAG: restriction endonuclease subunit S, partial [Thermoplasmatales archaeon]